MLKSHKEHGVDEDGAEMQKSTENRLSTLEALAQNQGEFQKEIRQYIKEGTQVRLEHMRDYTQHTTTVKNAIEKQLDYQKKCDDERSSQNQRLDSLEESRTYMKGAWAIVIALLGFLGFVK